jgi:hypothetical protein
MSDMHDVFGPPAEPTECFCLHCRRVFMSDLMIPIEVDDERHWMCPVPGCGAMGYTFDIFPMDNRHPDSGWVDDPPMEDDDVAEYDPALDTTDDDTDPLAGERIAEEVSESDGSFEPPTEWSPEADREDEDWEEWRDEDDDDADEEIIEEFGEEILPWENGESGEVTHPRRHFTRDDYEAAKQSGVYDEAVAREREHWRQIREQEKERKARIERGETLAGDQFSEDDIPF